MDQTQPPTMEQPAPLFADRYQIAAQQGEQVEALELSGVVDEQIRGGCELSERLKLRRSAVN